MDGNDTQYFGALLEEIRDEVKTMHEALAGLHKKVDNQPTQASFDELKDDIKVVKIAVTATNRDVVSLDQRVVRLETA